jgi:hypothetical protein
MSKYTPEIGDVVTTPATTFPMTVEAFNPNTMLCTLVGFAPGSVELTRVEWCAFDVTLVPAEAE